MIGCVLLLFTVSSTTHAQDLYFSGNVGLAIPSDSDLDYPGLPGNPEVESDNGLALALAAGYDFGNTRLECELTYQENDLDQAGYAGNDYDLCGDTSSFALLVNGYYDFVNQSRFTPFLSAGVGVAEVKVRDGEVNGTAITDIDDEDRVMAFQFSAGVGIAVSETLTVDVKYRYFGTEDAEIEDADIEYWSSNFYLGLRYVY